jgi:hypothetical protein
MRRSVPGPHGVKGTDLVRMHPTYGVISRSSVSSIMCTGGEYRPFCMSGNPFQVFSLKLQVCLSEIKHAHTDDEVRRELA